MPVIEVRSLAIYEAHKNAAKLAIDFSATWCGPCKKISPHFSELSDRYTDVVFLKIDVDGTGCENEQESSNISKLCQEKFQISAMPTFLVFKNGQRTGELVGASVQKLDELIEALEKKSA